MTLDATGTASVSLLAMDDQYGFLIITAVAVPAYVRKLMSHSSTGRASGCSPDGSWFESM